MILRKVHLNPIGNTMFNCSRIKLKLRNHMIISDIIDDQINIHMYSKLFFRIGMWHNILN